jgi:Trypsin-like peptidase domain
VENEAPPIGDPSASGPGRRVRKRNLWWVALGVVVIVLVSSIAYYRLLSPPPLTTKQVIALIQPSVVTVKVTVFRSDAVEASGFVYRKRGHILTNAHAIARALSIDVVDASGASHRAYLIGVDRVRDVAELVAYDMVVGVPKAQPLRAASGAVAMGAKVYSDESTQRGYANLGTKVDLGDQASAGTTSGIGNWGVNHRVVWRDRNVIVILLWDAESSSDVSITDVLKLADLRGSAIGANRASYQ